MTFTPPFPDPSEPPCRVNLYSDTQSKPSRGMREAMANAEVGDEQSGTDPTVRSLCDRLAALLNKEAAVFLPSGTMCNQVAMLVHCQPGDEVLAHRTAHILSAEASGPAALGGVQITGLAGERGQFSVDALRAAIRAKSRYAPEQRVVAVEQTSNSGGGSVWPVGTLHAVAEAARSFGLATHMDGARLLNACVASGVEAHVMASGYDSVWIDFTKGLGAPLGAVLAGSADFIDQAWRWKQRLGGSMRQAGVCAAACHYALDHNVDRLADDHALARRFAEGLAKIPGIEVEMPDTNLVFFDTSGTGLTAQQMSASLRALGIHVSTPGLYRLRAGFHLDIDAVAMQEALEAIRSVSGHAADTGGQRRTVAV